MTDLAADSQVDLQVGVRLEATTDVGDIHMGCAELSDPRTTVRWRRRIGVPYALVPSLLQVMGFTVNLFCLDRMRMLDLGVTVRLVGQTFRRILQDGMACGLRISTLT